MTRASPAFASDDIASAFAAFPEPERAGLLSLRSLIFETAAKTPAVGRLSEALKWGQPAYLTPETKSGSTIRLGIPKSGGFAIYTHCQTTLLTDFQILFPDDFQYEGNRAIHFCAGDGLPLEKLEILVRNALTYHLKK